MKTLVANLMTRSTARSSTRSTTGLTEGVDHSSDNPRRLKKIMVLFFLSLAIPSAILIYKSLEQLQWEAYYQHRQIAEDLASRIDERLNGFLKIEQARPFEHYLFDQTQTQFQRQAQNNPVENVIGRSPISNYPPRNTFPGLVGYFQIAPDGEFSTPLLPINLPGDSISSIESNISASEFEQRQSLQLQIEQILTNNNLLAANANSNTNVNNKNARQRITSDDDVALSSGSRYIESNKSRFIEQPRSESTPIYSSDQESAISVAESPVASVSRSAPSQAAFDKITLENSAPEQQRKKVTTAKRNLGELSKLELDSPYSSKVAARQKKEKKSNLSSVKNVPGSQSDVAAIQKPTLRVEESVATQRRPLENLEESFAIQEEPLASQQEPSASQEEPSASLEEPSAVLEKLSARSNKTPANLELSLGADDLSAIQFFENEVDALELTLLDSGHWVLFRKVWREGQRYIQGLLIEQEPFLSAAFEQEYRSSLVSQMSQLALVYRGNVLSAYGNSVNSYRLANAGDLNGTLLYRSRMSAPFNDLEGLYTINRLPSAAGSDVIWWSAIVLAAVLLLGTYAMYRFSLGSLKLVEQQQNFVSAVSHELKTPLTSIRMYGEILKTGWADQEKKQSYYNFIFDESERLTRLIDNVLALARMTRNETQANLQTMTVREVIELVRSKVSSQIKSEGFELRIVIENSIEEISVELDPDMISQVFINLVDNALKFASEASSKEIQISAIPEGNTKLSLAVRDFGPGIDAAQMKSIFKLFYRVENELTRETTGTGIGLALVNQLTRIMSGTVDVVNRNPGVEFKLTFARFS